MEQNNSNMSINTDQKNIDLPPNPFLQQNPFLNSTSNENKENPSHKIIITKNNNENSSESTENKTLTLPINIENNLLNKPGQNGEITTHEKKSELKIDLIKQANDIKEEIKKNEQIIFLREKLNELKDISNNELRQTCKEYYLIAREWMIKLNDFIKGENNVKLEDLKDKKDNDKFLIEKEKLNRALTLNQDKDKMIILKPKYAFAITLRPCPVNKPFWEFINKNLGLEPEVKDYAEPIEQEDGSITYKRVYCKYVKINCIILPKKRDYVNENNSYDVDYNNINLHWPVPQNYIDELMKNIQTFYFFTNKKVIVNDLMDTIENIVRKYQDIKLVDRNDYKCWIDLNYRDFEDQLKLIKEKISDIYNIYSTSPNSPLQLQNLEDADSREETPINKKFFFKLFPLKMFENEELIDIFPNQFTDNFDIISETKLSDRNENLRIKECPMEIIDKTLCFNRFPELTIIIEQGINTLFFKDESKLKYKIDPCNYRPCSNRNILTVFCECQKKYYCSLNCKIQDKIYHEDSCQYSLANYFMSMSQQITKPFMNESAVGLKGIRNIGNTCYMSTALQCISNCVELRNYFLFGTPRKDVNKNNVLGYKGLVAYGFEYLIKKLWVDNEPVIDLSKFKRAMGLCNERFGGRSQQDTHEFVTFLIDSLHEDLNRVNNKIYITREERELSDEIKSKIEWNNYLRRNQSILVDLFYGLFKSTVSCSVCNKSCVDFNTFNSISVNLKNNVKKQMIPEMNKENKINLSNQKNISTAITEMEVEKKDEESEKDNSSNTNQIEKKNIDENINNNSNMELSSKNEEMEMTKSIYKKEEVLVGGKPNESESLVEKKSENEFFSKIPLIFYFYSLDEKPIQFGLPVKEKKELSHKFILYKISQILNKDPYSLCLYHISNTDKNIINIYGKNNFYVYDTNNLENKILFVSEINHDVIRRNLTTDTNSIFYDAQIHKFCIDKKNTSREILEQNLNKNKENIKKVVNNIIEEKDIEKEIEDKHLSNYYMNLGRVFQFSLKNTVLENDGKPPKNIGFPRILFFSRNISILELYFEIFKINKRVILEEPIDKPEQIKESFNKSFPIMENNINISNYPFFMSLKIFDNIKKKAEKENILFLIEKNRKMQEIISKMIGKQNENDIQLILEVYWDQKYYKKLMDVLRPEKIDKLIEQDQEMKDKKQFLNESIDSTTKSSKGSNEDIQRLQKERYNNLYEKFSNLNCAPPHVNTSIEKNVNNSNSNIENQKNDNSGNIPNPQNGPAPKIIQNPFENIKTEISLNETFEILGEEELLDENNEWYCENCKKKQRAKKKLEIYNTPKILIIQIKRFSHTNKINTKVNFPLNDLDLSKYILSSDKSRPIKYDLFAVANHYGSLSFGHYTAFCKNSINEKWYEFNDSCVCEIKDLSKIVSSNAYVLFYKQKGLSKLKWNEIYKKQFIEIDINNPKSMVDYNDDFIKHLNKDINLKVDNDDINEYDIKIRETIKKIEKNKNVENIANKIETENKINININLNHDFLNKKRAPSGEI